MVIQWPNANRNEYYLDERHLYEDVEYVTDNLKHGLIHFAWAGGKNMVEKYYNDSNWKISNNTWTSTHYGENQKLKSSHERIFANVQLDVLNITIARCVGVLHGFCIYPKRCGLYFGCFSVVPIPFTTIPSDVTQHK